jgi:hypothetical protein
VESVGGLRACIPLFGNAGRDIVDHFEKQPFDLIKLIEREHYQRESACEFMATLKIAADRE